MNDYPRGIFVDVSIEGIANARSFREAEARLRVSAALTKYFSFEQMASLLKNVEQNTQVALAGGVPGILFGMLTS